MQEILKKSKKVLNNAFTSKKKKIQAIQKKMHSIEVDSCIHVYLSIGIHVYLKNRCMNIAPNSGARFHSLPFAIPLNTPREMHTAAARPGGRRSAAAAAHTPPAPSGGPSSGG